MATDLSAGLDNSSPEQKKVDPQRPAPPTEPGLPPPPVNPTVYLRQAESLLLELETSWERGAAGPVLEECSRFLAPQTVESYRLIIRKGAPPLFRRALLAKRLKLFAHDVRPPLHVFPASAGAHQAPSPAEPGAPAPSSSGFLVESPGVSRIRMNQAFAARRWGIWYALDSPESQQRLEAAWSRNVIETFEMNLRAMNRLPRSARVDKAPWELGDVGGWFEQLILDLLNEEALVARRAPLLEDLFEKTDLRVSYPTLQRKRGARVQVTLLTDEGLHGAKLRRIARGDELVVVSPLKLAAAALEPAGTPPFSHEHQGELFAALFRPAPSVPTVAAALKRHFLQALGNPASPLGPVLAVAAPVRRFIRMYVEREAHGSTQHLRKREAATGETLYPPSRFMR